MGWESTSQSCITLVIDRSPTKFLQRRVYQSAYHSSKSWLVRLLILLVAILLCSNTNTNMQAKCSISFLVAKKVVVSFSTTSVEEIISVEERSLIISHKESLRVSSLSFLSEEEDSVPHLCLVRCFQQNDTMQPLFSVLGNPSCKLQRLSNFKIKAFANILCSILEIGLPAAVVLPSCKQECSKYQIQIETTTTFTIQMV